MNAVHFLENVCWFRAVAWKKYIFFIRQFLILTSFTYNSCSKNIRMHTLHCIFPHKFHLLSTIKNAIYYKYLLCFFLFLVNDYQLFYQDLQSPAINSVNVILGFHQSCDQIKIVTIQWKKSRVWDMIDDWYTNNLAKNQVSVVFHSRVICTEKCVT